MRIVCAYLDEVLAFSLGYEWLELGCSEGVDQTSLGNDEEKDLGTGENRQFIRLPQSTSQSSKICTERAKMVQAQ